MKWFLALHVTLFKLNAQAEEVFLDTFFRGEVEALLLTSDIEQQYNAQVELVMRRLNEFLRSGSGWIVYEVLDVEIHTVAYQPIRGSSYIPSPAFIASCPQCAE